MSRVLAFDFGASSGRALLATYENNNLSYEEVHRFDNSPRDFDGHFRWDFNELLTQVKIAIEKAGQFDSIGFDTWGVDFGLLDENGNLIADPIHYRDSRTDGIIEKVLTKISPQELYEKTGSQNMYFNTFFQMVAMEEQEPEVLAKAKTALFMSDLFGYMLTGKAVCEQTIASTSQMFDLKTGKWNTPLMEEFNLPTNLFLPTVASGTIVGEINGAKLVTVAGHDTQCASAAVPTQKDDVAFVSCGTWSILGTELDEPIFTEMSAELGLSHELGANGKINYLKNITGLWMIQESRRAWRKKGEEYSYADLERLALETPPLQSFVDPDAPEFASPGDIPAHVQEYCRKTGQKVPQTVGEIMRCIYESLALKYRLAIDQLQESTGKKFSALHILGGGTKDGLLCQMSANSTGLPIVAGPIEATALGNIIIQLMAIGDIASISEGRDLIARTENLKHYEGVNTSDWNLAYEKYKTII